MENIISVTGVILLMSLISACNNPPNCGGDAVVKQYPGGSYFEEYKGKQQNIVYVHGGGWSIGSKDVSFFYSRSARSQAVLADYNLYSVDYTLWDRQTGENAHPTQRDEIIGFLESLDGKSVLIGYSAGGHIVASIAEVRPDLVSSIITYGGLFEFSEQFATDYKQSFEGPVQYFNDSVEDPTLGELSVPALLMAGFNDYTVNYMHSQVYAERSGADFTLYPAQNHYFFVFGFCGAEIDSQMTTDILDFIVSL